MEADAAAVDGGSDAGGGIDGGGVRDGAADASPDAAADAGADAGVDAGADAGADANADAAVEPPPDIDGSRTGFTRYGNLRIAFVGDVDPEGIQVELVPERPAGLVPSSITAVATDVVDVALPKYHLPIDYTVVVTFDTAAGPQAVEGLVDGTGNGSRVAFISSASGTGDLGSWTVDPADEALDAADTVCQQEAADAGLEGSFAAFLSVSGETDAFCRLLGSDGRVADDCGFAGGVPTDTAAILDGAGRPILFGADAVAAGEWRLPVRLFADGTQAPERSFAWTGSTDVGVARSADCGGWTVADDTTVGMAAAGVDDRVPHTGHGPRCDLSNVSSSWTFRLLCFQTGAGFFEPADELHVRTGKRAFVTFDEVSPDLGGPSGGDAVCQSAADGAGLTGTFVAWLSDETDDAYCRLAGGTGERADGCGLDDVPQGGPWVRADGYLVAESLDELTDGAIESPILLDENGDFVGITAGVYTGTAPDGTPFVAGGAYDCGGWMIGTSGASGSGGVAAGAGRSWTQYFSTSCTATRRLYCFEQ